MITSFTRHQRWARTVAVAALALQAGAAGVSAPLWAQTVPPISDTRGQRDDPRRAELERRFQQRVEATVRQRLQLNDDQAARLREVASRTEGARRALRRDEMEARKAMRTELLAGDNANETRVAELLEQMPRLERRRIELLEQEQRELARFLTPLQRARYFALQDELRRGMQELQRRRLGDGDTVRNGPPGAEQRMRRRPPGGGW
ncbi:Spy/CpxP family protein refolding chaperone [Gemmatimonas sp.]|uniref:Spy/CpxP family protein refolding chaperone n=1 Tax=Gemmatimonas sp. TaxID=1962908 RepID=UPI0037C037F0